MKDTFVHDFCKIYMNDISQESIDKFNNLLSFKEFSTNEVIKVDPLKNQKFYIIVDGIIANYSQDEKANKEYIRAILFEKHVFINLTGLDFVEHISTDYYKCLTKVKFLVGDLNDFFNLAQNSVELFNFIIKLNHVSIYYLQNRLDRLSLLDATNRYKILKKRIPNIENLIPQYQIASYLNITPVQLSRIRKKMYSI
ncbi:Crp/Fnr family transcriptional regulator [Tenacibaculum jejuense]|uniref:Probable cAMP-binding protein n=1 Tax=Tenacibaculum jejuense TaxID=584609 RepID=A0A238U854_9FLAO|nr:Crp/Fnr family transcriptional regulator [Tenacibaculum jejuense]SNR15215.1 Probable cAMP-binding protein [Tenacibaculum jejuense]